MYSIDIRALFCGNVDFEGVRFGACVEACRAADAAFASIHHGLVASGVKNIAYGKHLLGACVNAASARLAFQTVDQWIRLAFVNFHYEFLLFMGLSLIFMF